ncbi:ABC transporter ATP-binding protein [Jeotgalibacillus terrae]|uniref:ABC transporter ATP-binding protein n=1 Tax=Jeotgalibacillus terrae TaxID=587735 RepID=A0ABW5ZPE3_9BACL|nr:ABC transporter ATP-binding protein [Jeotgalibacillus terrae]MBM7581160.1 energy-coupling factor transport system ATP-binding protein [Jeotgalibacillus terrae]
MRKVISLQDVSFRFPDDEMPVFEHINFEVRAGERVVITGPSGCGKSSLLYLLNRLYPENCDGIVSGTVELFEKPASMYAPGEINRRIATVFQDPDSQFCMQTVEEELAFTLENVKVPTAEIDARIQKVLKETGLESFRDAVIQTLSGGQKQRVATACAWVLEPEILLLDEPLTHLDPVTAQDFVKWLKHLHEKGNLTVIAIDHQVDMWGDFFDREWQMVSGKRLEPAFTREPLRSGDVALSAKELAVEPIVSPVTFTLKKGEIAVLAGPNGSGKSTLLKALCGLKSTGGSVSPERIGYVPQSPEFLFITKSVREELSFGGGSGVDEVLKRLYLDDVSESNPFAVSHGQKRRTAIGAMLCDGRPVITMDEPTAGQDAAALRELENLIIARANEGVTFLIVTHDMNFADRIADSLLLLREGELSGPYQPQTVWENRKLLERHHLLAPSGGESCDQPHESFG